tara:strand:- start:401 stop:844 length:444 start_codon:yes stop_codon:yes gene_type:complete
MYLISVTLDVSKLTGWLKACALWNMRNMVVTLEVSHLERSPLKPESLKRFFMSVIPETSQSGKGPWMVLAPTQFAAATSATALLSATVDVKTAVDSRRPSGCGHNGFGTWMGEPLFVMARSSAAAAAAHSSISVISSSSSQLPLVRT